MIFIIIIILWVQYVVMKYNNVNYYVLGNYFDSVMDYYVIILGPAGPVPHSRGFSLGRMLSILCLGVLFRVLHILVVPGSGAGLQLFASIFFCEGALLNG